jgi:hypothetical protein
MAHHDNGSVVIDTGGQTSRLDEGAARFVYVRPAI